MKSKAIIFTDPNRIELDFFELTPPQAGQLIVKTIYSGVSTGTETRVLSGKQTGSQFPLIPGYENVGEVVEIGEGCTFSKGELVFHAGSGFTGSFQKCWGGHLEYALVAESDVFRIPAGLRPDKAVHAKVGAIALHGVKRAQVSEKDTVAIVGLGLIGHWAAQCSKALGADVIGIDMSQIRLDMAAAGGVGTLIDASKENVKEKVVEYSDDNVSVAIDVTGVSGTIRDTAELLRPMPWSQPYPPSPKLLILGSHTDPVILDYDALFMKDADVLFSRDTRAEDITEMLNLLADKRVYPDALATQVFSADNATQAYRQMLEQKIMRMIFRW